MMGRCTMVAQGEKQSWEDKFRLKIEKQKHNNTGKVASSPVLFQRHSFSFLAHKVEIKVPPVQCWFYTRKELCFLIPSLSHLCQLVDAKLIKEREWTWQNCPQLRLNGGHCDSIGDAAWIGWHWYELRVSETRTLEQSALQQQPPQGVIQFPHASSVNNGIRKVFHIGQQVHVVYDGVTLQTGLRIRIQRHDENDCKGDHKQSQSDDQNDDGDKCFSLFVHFLVEAVLRQSLMQSVYFQGGSDAQSYDTNVDEAHHGNRYICGVHYHGKNTR